MYFFQNMYLARSLSEAFALFDAHPAARWIAGGSDVLIQLRNHDFPQTELISIQQIDALRGISLLQDGTLEKEGRAYRIANTRQLLRLASLTG